MKIVKCAAAFYAFLSISLLQARVQEQFNDTVQIDHLDKRELLEQAIKLHQRLNSTFNMMKEKGEFSTDSILKTQKDVDNIMRLVNQLFVIDREEDVQLIQECFSQFDKAMANQNCGENFLSALQNSVKILEPEIMKHFK